MKRSDKMNPEKLTETSFPGSEAGVVKVYVDRYCKDSSVQLCLFTDLDFD